MKLPAFQVLFLSSALLAGCTCMSRVPAGAVDPKGRWHRDQDGLITSGITAESSKEEEESSSTAGVIASRSFPGERHDPLEAIPEFKKAFECADRGADKKIARLHGQLGAIHAFWEEKKKILRERFRIDWKSPAELNPSTCYD